MARNAAVSLAITPTEKGRAYGFGPLLRDTLAGALNPRPAIRRALDDGFDGIWMAGALALYVVCDAFGLWAEALAGSLGLGPRVVLATSGSLATSLLVSGLAMAVVTWVLGSALDAGVLRLMGDRRSFANVLRAGALSLALTAPAALALALLAAVGALIKLWPMSQDVDRWVTLAVSVLAFAYGVIALSEALRVPTWRALVASAVSWAVLLAAGLAASELVLDLQTGA